MKFVHAADLHLDSPMRGLEQYERAPREKMRDATRRALENLVDLCIDESAAFLLIAGDLYDGDWKEYGTGLFFSSQMSRLNTAGIPVVMIRGNHDAQRQMTRSLKLPPNVRDLAVNAPESVPIPNTNVIVHGQGFAERVISHDLAAGYPHAKEGAFNIGLLHTSLTGRAGHEPYAPTSLETLKSKGYQYWALGHVHAFEVALSYPHVVFPGNLQGRHARETGPKGAVLVEVDNDRVVRVDHRALDDVRWCVAGVDLSEATDFDDALLHVSNAIAELVSENAHLTLAIRIVLEGATPAHTEITTAREKFINEVRNACFVAHGDLGWIEKVVLSTTAPLDLARARSRTDAAGELARSIDALRRDDAQLQERCTFLDALSKKLPRELERGTDPVLFHDPNWRRSLVDQVEQILLPRLLEKEEP